MTNVNLPEERPGFDLSVLEKVIIQGDLSKLTPQERLVYYTKVCESVGLNPLTKPFDYIQLDGKLTLYAKRDCTDQLRKIHNISITVVNREKIGDVYCVTARGTTPDGRTDESIGAVPLLKEEKVWDPDKFNPKTGKKGAFVNTGKLVPLDAVELANALMKAETKAKRRVTLSIAGLGWLDETEIETVEGTKRVVIDEDQPQLPPPEDEPAAPQTRTNPPGNQGRNPSSSKPVKNADAEKADDSGEALYRLLDAKIGKSGKGTHYLKIKAEHAETKEIVEAYAHEPNVIDQINEVEGLFKMEYASEKGVNVVKAVTPVKTANTNKSVFVLVRKEHGKSPSGVPYAKLHVRDESGETELVLVRDESLIELVNQTTEGSTIQFDFEMHNGFKVVKFLRVLGDAA